MFSIFSRSAKASEKTDYSFLKADMHSHLLPGIDDGSPDINTSLELVRGMTELGFTKLITTPHIMWDMYRNDPTIISGKLAVLQSAVRDEKIQVELAAGAEYFLDDYVAGLARNKETLLPISGNMILVEFSMAHPSMSLNEVLFEIQMRGYQPVIAHPERYIYLTRAKEFYDDLKNSGCYFQLNLLSLGSYYGKAVHDLAQYLLKKEYYDLVGTDLHNARHLDALRDPVLLSPLKKLFDTGKIRNNLL